MISKRKRDTTMASVGERLLAHLRRTLPDPEAVIRCVRKRRER